MSGNAYARVFAGPRTAGMFGSRPRAASSRSGWRAPRSDAGEVAMTAVKITIFSFSCDQPGCREVVEIMPDLPYLSYAARQLREREGWATGQGKYFCPAHKRSLRNAGLTPDTTLVTLVATHPAGDRLR
jgi:hypothetical protein